MVITVTLNPAYDIYCTVPSLVPGTEMRCRFSSKYPGGKGINTSRALKKLGIESKAALLMGRENCDGFLSLAREEGLSLLSVTVSGAIRENITVIEADGRETRLSGDFCIEGSAADEIFAAVKNSVSPGDTVVFSGSLPKGVDKSDVTAFLCSLKGVRLAVDSKSLGIDEIKQIKPWLVKPNEDEVKAFGTSLEEAALALRAAGCDGVLVSLGEGGAYFSGRESFYAPAPEIKAVSTVGAGDCAVAGFIFAALSGMSERDCTFYAVAAGSAACLCKGTAPPSKEAVKALFEMIKQ